MELDANQDRDVASFKSELLPARAWVRGSWLPLHKN